MSRKKRNRKQQHEQPPDTGRRKFVLLGAGALAVAGAGLAGAYRAGWFNSERISPSINPIRKNLTPVSLPADHRNASRAADEMLEQYARDLNNPSVIAHAIRGFGKGFKLADGTSAVDHLCSRYAAEKEVNGKRYIYFKRDAEVHENSFLKTFLEAGVSLDQPITVSDSKYSLRDLAESGKSLFRYDPQNLYRYDDNRYRYDTAYFPPRQVAPGQPTVDLRGELIHEHLPWGLIAFSILTAPEKAKWTNAYGEKIDLRSMIDSSLSEYESTCSLGLQEMARGESASKTFRDAIKKYSCFGIHTAYSFLVCMKNGYNNDNLPQRVKQMMDFVTYRLKGDAAAIDHEYTQEARGAPAQLVDAFRTRALIKFYGHAFEAINYAKLHRIIGLAPGQQQRIQAGEQRFYDSIVKMRAMDWSMLRKSLGEKFISDVVVAMGHAARAMKLLTPE